MVKMHTRFISVSIPFLFMINTPAETSNFNDFRIFKRDYFSRSI